MSSRDIFQLPVNDRPSTEIELADGGRRYRKQLVKFGSYVNPNEPSKKMVLDRTWAEKVAANLKAKVLNKVPIVNGHPKDMADSATLLEKTKGWLSGVSVEDDGLYGEIDIKEDDTAAGIDKGLIDDVSISYDPNYVKKDTGEAVGPALLHIGLVNDPYLKGMQPFQALSDSTNVIMLSESKESIMSNVQVKNDRDFPVDVKVTVDGEEKTLTVAPGAEVEIPEDAAEAVKTQLTEAVKPELTAEEKAAEEQAAKEAAEKEAVDKAKQEADATAKSDAEKLAEAQKELSEMRSAQLTKDAETSYDQLVRDGKLVPAQKAAFIALSTAQTSQPISLSDGSTKPLSALVADLMAAAPAVVRFSEQGQSEGEVEKTPITELSEDQRKGLGLLGISEEDYNKYNKVKQES